LIVSCEPSAFPMQTLFGGIRSHRVQKNRWIYRLITGHFHLSLSVSVTPRMSPLCWRISRWADGRAETHCWPDQTPGGATPRFHQHRLNNLTLL